MDSNQTKPKQREGFSSDLGFILVSAGASIGLGNLWKFPYIVGIHGGGLFIVFYIIFAVIIGIPLLLCEMAIGRKTRLGPIAAFKKLNPKWSFIGIFGVAAALVMLCYYTVIGGWVIKYMISYISNSEFLNNNSKGFYSFIESPFEPSIYAVIFTLICAFIVNKGVSQGIEKASKIMLPILFLFLIILAIRSLFLPSAVEGIKFLFSPDFSVLNSPKNILLTLGAALSQMFFSISVGMGIVITYGSYLNENENLKKSSSIIVFLDTVVAILSGIIIMPAVFSFGFEPDSGPGLIFQILPQVFGSIAFGGLFGAVFFILVFFAALTSAIAVLEVVSVSLVDSLGFKRFNAVMLMTLIISILSVFVSLSNGILSDFKILNMNLFDLAVFLTDRALMPLTVILTCIYIGYIAKTELFIEEIEKGATKLKSKSLFKNVIKYIAPVFIAIILIIGMIKI